MSHKISNNANTKSTFRKKKANGKEKGQSGRGEKKKSIPRPRPLRARAQPNSYTRSLFSLSALSHPTSGSRGKSKENQKKIEVKPGTVERTGVVEHGVLDGEPGDVERPGGLAESCRGGEQVSQHHRIVSSAQITDHNTGSQHRITDHNTGGKHRIIGHNTGSQAPLSSNHLCTGPKS